MRFPLAAALSSVLLFTSIARADPILYGGNGGHPNFDGTPLSIHNGWLVGIDQDTGTVVPIGHPDDVARISGITFASYDLLYATTLSGGGFPDTPPPPNSSRLVLINPNTGALVSDFGLIKAAAGGQGIWVLGINGTENPLNDGVAKPRNEESMTWGMTRRSCGCQNRKNHLSASSS